MSWSTWLLLKKIVSPRTCRKEAKGTNGTLECSATEISSGAEYSTKTSTKKCPKRAGLFLGRISSKEDLDLQCLSSNSSSSLANGQFPHSSIVGMVIIDASTASVLPTLPRIVHSPERIIQGRIPIRTTTKARAKGKWCKFGRGELISLLLQSFPKEHQS